MEQPQGGGTVAPPTKKPPPKPRRYIRIPLSLFVVLAVLIIGAGFVHVAHGGGVGLKVCWKDGWALSDTFVDLDDYIGRPFIQVVDKTKVLRAMFECGALEPPAWMKDQEGRDPVTDEVRERVRRLAYEAFATWSAENTTKWCPDHLREVARHTNETSTIDVWGHELRMACGPTKPADAPMFGVFSIGPDGREGTSDDVKSWD